MRLRLMRFPEGKAKAFTLSYDDGHMPDMKFSDIITGYGLKCTFNLCTSINNILNKEQVEEYILSRGHEIAVHGACHRASGMLRPTELIREVLECRAELEDKFAIIVRGMAYPDSGITRWGNNANYADVKSVLKSLDIAYARTLGGDNDDFLIPSDFHAWMPTAHHKNENLMSYIDEFLKLDLSPDTYYVNRYPRLFYLWGHSHEFERDNNWDLLETICEKISNNNEIWYATNIEIYNYVQAYYSLVFSANSKIVFNPTVYEVWFDVDGVPYSIKPGETLKI